ncbi:F-box/kelch-repeat protein SKIP4 [Cucurbita moschata]|uniref:F-box/kelch-repeat protein SKIP4 n=1 Tax=Cucurbita moschata TaxID=3662 RepID=A0A6J1EFA9_CUCMO|nr:F-box/kelch-repeat protein SKIP4 [Cucurbita moschata]XP_022924534.1 F-box/kelch-repeat protein SKIP4 [Cucurbita moschata]XP_022924535.1 F-box/kelch-repeat protein SKIP4 [Cucurbita moschata]XP_022924536.1 F-box/kelch-repeat protein SKIP4 [Cucurbita moschata]
MDSVLGPSGFEELIPPTGRSLIPGLPDDIVLSILSRVPRKYHHNLKSVSKRWKDLVNSEEWYSCREKNDLAETWIYALCRDKSEQVSCYVLDLNSSKRRWKQMKSLPSCSFKRKGMGFEAMGRKLYLLGGCSWSEDATDEVYCYDTSTNSWSSVAPLSSARCYFACEVLNEKLYAIGGLCSNSGDRHSWDIYDPCTNKWEPCLDITNIQNEIESSIVMDGKIYIRQRHVDSQAYALVYDPSSGTWEHSDSEMVSGWRGPAVIVDKTLYVLDQSSGTRLMMWNNEVKEWIPVGRFSALLTRPPCQLVAVGKIIVVVGKGLSSVIFNVDNARTMEGLMVSSSIPRLDSDVDVLSCKCVTI